MRGRDPIYKMPKKADILSDFLARDVNLTIRRLAGDIYDEIHSCFKSYAAKPVSLSLVMVTAVGTDQTYDVASQIANKHDGMDSMRSMVRACFLGDIENQGLNTSDKEVLSDFAVDIVQSFATDLYQFFSHGEKVLWQEKANLPPLNHGVSREELLQKLGSYREKSSPVTSDEEVDNSSWVSSVSPGSEHSIEGKT